MGCLSAKEIMKLNFSLILKHKCKACNGSGKLDHHASVSTWPSNENTWIRIICLYCHGTGRMEFKKL